MSPLRRSLREVYRVYDEDQLLGEPPAADELSGVLCAQSVRVRDRLAVAAALAGTLGAVGGIVLATGLGLSATHRRTNGSLAAAADPSARPGPRATESTPAAEPPAVPPATGERMVPARERTGASHGALLHGTANGGARGFRAKDAGRNRGVPRAGAQQILAGSPASVLRSPAGRGHPEFGFER